MEYSKAISTSSTFEMQTSVTININASEEKIMTLLTDIKNFTKWNSTVLSIKGNIKKGEKIELVSALDPKRVFKLQVAELTPTQLIWKDGFAPMFSGVRTFELKAQKNGSTNFSMIEVFKGIMLPMIKGSLPDFRENFEQFSADLKIAAEAIY